MSERKYVIVSDSCCDLHKALRDKYDVSYIPMRNIADDGDTPSSLDWEYIPYKVFYDNMRKGIRYRTAQINTPTYLDEFEKFLADGYDILSISCSSALSGSVNMSRIASEELLQKYPQAKIRCIDSLNSGFGLGILVMAASKMRAEGKTIDEVAAWLEANKLRSNQIATVDSLSYLRRAGRVAATSAIFGGLLDIKPIIISDAIGQNAAVEKVKGRKMSVKRLLSKFLEVYEDDPYQVVVVADADCPEEGDELYEKVKAAIPNKNVEVMRDRIGPIIGASAGPGTLSIYCLGKEVTDNKPVE